MLAAFPRPAVAPARRRICFVVPPVTAEDRYGPMAAAGNSLPPHAFLYQPQWITVADKRVKGLWKDMPIFANDLSALHWT